MPGQSCPPPYVPHAGRTKDLSQVAPAGMSVRMRNRDCLWPTGRELFPFCVPRRRRPVVASKNKVGGKVLSGTNTGAPTTAEGRPQQVCLAQIGVQSLAGKGTANVSVPLGGKGGARKRTDAFLLKKEKRSKVNFVPTCLMTQYLIQFNDSYTNDSYAFR